MSCYCEGFRTPFRHRTRTTRAAAAAAESSDPYSVAVAKVLDSLPEGAEVMMVAHSQGGIAAVNASTMTTARMFKTSCRSAPVRTTSIICRVTSNSPRLRT